MSFRFGAGSSTSSVSGRRPLSPAKIGAAAVANLATPTHHIADLRLRHLQALVEVRHTTDTAPCHLIHLEVLTGLAQ